jgi:predicted dehydrogenase
VASVYGEVSGGGELDERFFAVLEHRDGMTTHVSGDWAQGAPGPRFRVRGSAGSYVIGGMDGQEEALIAGRSPATEGDAWGTEPPERWGRLQRGETSEPVPSERGRCDTYYPAFAAAVRGEAPVPVDPNDAVASLGVIDAIRASAAQRRAVEPYH